MKCVFTDGHLQSLIGYLRRSPQVQTKNAMNVVDLMSRLIEMQGDRSGIAALMVV